MNENMKSLLEFWVGGYNDNLEISLDWKEFLEFLDDTSSLIFLTLITEPESNSNTAFSRFAEAIIVSAIGQAFRENEIDPKQVNRELIFQVALKSGPKILEVAREMTNTDEITTNE